MAIQIEKGGWALIFLVGAGITGYSLWQYGLLEKIMPSAKTTASAVPRKAELPAPAVSSNPKVTPVGVPASTPGCADKPEVRMLVWAWNAQMGLMFANGGAQATSGSLMCKNGVNLKLLRQDDPSKMQEALIAFANDMKKGHPDSLLGTHFVAIMGDGGATFLKGLNDTLKKLGPDYTAKVVGSAGYSRGEDKFMGPPEWKTNPSASRGGLVSGVLRDGDWNIAQKWLGDNGLCNNPDEKTWDAGCLNWVATSDYIDAAEKYVAGYCEERPVVDQGKRTGEKKRVCVNGVVTWTPGDVTVAQKKGGLASIASTKEYASQMPNTIIGIDRWMKDNRSTVEGMLQAIFDGGDQVKAVPAALRHAAGVSAMVYKEANADAAYWENYYHGVTERDKQGLTVELGGSSVNNLADNLQLFGLTPGSANLFAATYRVFGEIVVAQYPSLVPNFYPAEQITDTSYIAGMARKAAPVTEAEPKKFSAQDAVQTVVSRRSWNINFDTGKSTFTSSARGDLERLLRDLLVASGTVVEVHGHTDSVGSPEANMALSESRAFAVKQYMEQASAVNFPAGRVRVFAHGQTQPLAPNTTEAGKAQNRRVEIVLGTTGK
ncbi:MAG: OmpA family protein [Acidobacteria bacterium]|nr:OmpA family protein [Acidobacteriota bacterium]